MNVCAADDPKVGADIGLEHATECIGEAISPRPTTDEVQADGGDLVDHEVCRWRDKIAANRHQRRVDQRVERPPLTTYELIRNRSMVEGGKIADEVLIKDCECT